MYVVKMHPDSHQYVSTSLYMAMRGMHSFCWTNLQSAMMFESKEAFSSWLDSGKVNYTMKRFWFENPHAQVVLYTQEVADTITTLLGRMA